MVRRSERAAQAMARLPDADPSLASLSLWCRVVDGGAQTRTTAEAIKIGEDFTALPMREQIGLLGHHILHIALRHEPRMAAMAQRWGGAFQAGAYNLAADAIVNECLEQAGHAIPRPAPTLSTLLIEVLQEDPQDALSRWDVDRLYMALTSMDGAGDQRRASYAQSRAFQTDLEPDASAGEDQDEAEWRGHLTRATEVSSAAGRGVGTVLGGVGDLPRVSTPWEVHLRRLLTRAVREAPRQSYSRPQRTWLAQDAEARRTGGPQPVFQPGRRRDAKRARIVIGVDTSGSIDDALLALLAAEVSGVARRTGAEVHVLAFDETVHVHMQNLSSFGGDAFAQLQLRRSGGTAYVDVIEQAEALAPSIIVILTDLDGAFGETPKGEVVWATPLPAWDEPPFGRVLSLAR